MNRSVSAQLHVTVNAPSRLAFQVGVANPGQYSAQESIAISLGGAPIGWTDVPAPHGGRVWLVDAQPGNLALNYQAELTGSAAAAPIDVGDELLYLRPSRYCESDRLVGFASRQFHDITTPTDVLAAVSSWVGTQLEYVSGSSGPTDGAVDTLVAGRGVCRDFAHLAISLLRAKNVPARLAAVYAPGLSPMDFHAVAEAHLNGAWHVIDPTGLAPRESMLRITAGRDSSDTAFLSTVGGSLSLTQLQVTAVIDGELPDEDPAKLVTLH